MGAEARVAAWGWVWNFGWERRKLEKKDGDEEEERLLDGSQLRRRVRLRINSVSDMYARWKNR